MKGFVIGEGEATIRSKTCRLDIWKDLGEKQKEWKVFLKNVDYFVLFCFCSLPSPSPQKKRRI